MAHFTSVSQKQKQKQRANLILREKKPQETEGAVKLGPTVNRAETHARTKELSIGLCRIHRLPGKLLISGCCLSAHKRSARKHPPDF